MAEKQKKPKKPKYKSRATRCSEACGTANAAAAEIRTIAEGVDDILEEVSKDTLSAEAAKAINDVLDGEIDGKPVKLISDVHFSDLSSAAGEIRNLADEMTSWRDNIEEHFSQTDKYERVSEAADTLEQAADDLENIEEPTAPEIKEGTEKSKVEEYTSDLIEAADSIESAASDAENVEFPTARG